MNDHVDPLFAEALNSMYAVAALWKQDESELEQVQVQETKGSNANYR